MFEDDLNKNITLTNEGYYTHEIGQEFYNFKDQHIYYISGLKEGDYYMKKKNSYRAFKVTEDELNEQYAKILENGKIQISLTKEQLKEYDNTIVMSEDVIGFGKGVE